MVDNNDTCSDREEMKCDDRGLNRFCRIAVIVLLVAIAILGCALRAYKLGVSYRVAEVCTRRDSFGPLGSLPVFWGKAAFYTLEHFALKLGDHESNLRLPGFLAGILAIPLIFFLGSGVCNKYVGLIAAFLLSFSTFNINKSHDGRYYSMMMLAAVASLLILHIWSNGTRRWIWILWIFVPLFGLFVHPFFALFLGAASVGYFIWILFRKNMATWGDRLRPLIFFSIITFLAFAPFNSLYIPSLLGMTKDISQTDRDSVLNSSEETTVKQEKKEERREYNKPKLKYGVFRLTPKEYMTLLNKQFMGLLPGGGVSIFILLILGLIWLIRKSPMISVVCLCVIVLPPLALFFVKVSHWYSARYFAYLSPPVILLVAAGLYSVVEAINSVVNKIWQKQPNSMNKRTEGVKFLCIVVMLLALLPFQASSVSAYYSKWPEGDWRSIAKYMSNRISHGDIVFYGVLNKNRASMTNGVIEYYLKQYDSNGKAVVRTIKIQNSQDVRDLYSLMLKNPNKTIWVVTFEDDLTSETKTALDAICDLKPIESCGSALRVIGKPTRNLVPYGGFEEGFEGIKLPAYTVWEEGDRPQHGRRTLRIDNQKPGESRKFRFPITDVLKDDYTYTLSFDLKCENIKPGMNYNQVVKVVFNGKDSNDKSFFNTIMLVRKTDDWEHFVFHIFPGRDMPSNPNTLFISFGLFGGTGTMWVDNVQLETGPIETPFVEGARPPHTDRLVELNLS